jgi:Na+/proline symporter
LVECARTDTTRTTTDDSGDRNLIAGIVAPLAVGLFVAAAAGSYRAFSYLAAGFVVAVIGAAAISRDIPRALGAPIEDDATELRVTQGALVGLTMLSTVIVLYSTTLVGILGTIGWGFFAAAFFAVAAIGLN